MNWFGWFKKGPRATVALYDTFDYKQCVISDIELSCKGVARLDVPGRGLEMKVSGVPVNLSSVSKITVNIEPNKLPVVVVEYI